VTVTGVRPEVPARIANAMTTAPAIAALAIRVFRLSAMRGLRVTAQTSCS
jgi:hypothetical protein